MVACKLDVTRSFLVPLDNAVQEVDALEYAMSLDKASIKAEDGGLSESEKDIPLDSIGQNIEFYQVDEQGSKNEKLDIQKVSSTVLTDSPVK